jgi:cytochrome c oxidase subunit 3
MADIAHEEHFESLERQAQASRLGMWVFLASEVLLFGGFFALYAGYRAQSPEAVAIGIAHADVLIGTVNTAVLLVSSFFVAWAVRMLRLGAPRASGWLVLSAVALGLVFLVLKGVEYRNHLAEGIDPTGFGPFVREHPEHGLGTFFTLYYIATGTHGIHVAIGVLVLAFFAFLLFSGRLTTLYAHRLEVAGLYWHLVDAIWIFLWPLFYLTGSHG